MPGDIGPDGGPGAPGDQGEDGLPGLVGHAVSDLPLTYTAMEGVWASHFMCLELVFHFFFLLCIGTSRTCRPTRTKRTKGEIKSLEVDMSFAVVVISIPLISSSKATKYSEGFFDPE